MFCSLCCQEGIGLATQQLRTAQEEYDDMQRQLEAANIETAELRTNEAQLKDKLETAEQIKQQLKLEVEQMENIVQKKELEVR